jgi:hypothetical protein
VIRKIALLDRRHHYGPYWRCCSRLMNAERVLQQLEARARKVCWFARHNHSRAEEICGNLSCTSVHFQALSCNGRLPKGCKIRYLVSTVGTHMPGSKVRVPPFP